MKLKSENTLFDPLFYPLLFNLPELDSITQLKKLDIPTQLEKLEKQIDLCSLAIVSPHLKNFDSFKCTLNAINKIVQNKLYKCKYLSVETYFKIEFQISRAHVYRIVEAAKIVDELTESWLTELWDFTNSGESTQIPIPLPIL